MSTEEINQKLLKNSLFLVIRLLFVMFVSLYTSRVILNALGIEDYGLYNVVYGFVTLFSLFSDSLSSSFSRFLTVEVAKKDSDAQRRVFTASVNILILFTLIIYVFSQVFGIWYFGKVINVPTGRESVVNVVFQISLVTFIFNMLKVSCTSMLIAHEHTGVYGIFSIVDALLKLIIVYLLALSPQDKLITYVVLLLAVSLISFSMNSLYCLKHFECFHYLSKVPKTVYQDMFSYMGWSFTGLLSYTFNLQGITLLVNRFLGVVVNASRGIATQVDGATRQFVYSISVAINPQIIKSYTVKDYDYLNKLLYFSSKTYCFVMLLYAIPLSFEAKTVLTLWLVNVPPLTVELVQLTFLATLFVLMIRPVEVAIQASGYIKYSQIATAVCSFITLLVVAGCLMADFGIIVVYSLVVSYSASLVVVQLYCLKKQIDIHITDFLKNVTIRVLITGVLSSIIPYALIKIMPETIARLLLTLIMSTISTIIIVLYIGYTKSERAVLLSNIKKIIKR